MHIDRSSLVFWKHISSFAHAWWIRTLLTFSQSNHDGFEHCWRSQGSLFLLKSFAQSSFCFIAFVCASVESNLFDCSCGNRTLVVCPLSNTQQCKACSGIEGLRVLLWAATYSISLCINYAQLDTAGKCWQLFLNAQILVSTLFRGTKCSEMLYT